MPAHSIRAALNDWGIYCLIGFFYALANNSLIFAVTLHCVALRATPFEMGLLGSIYFGIYALVARLCSSIRRRVTERILLVSAPLISVMVAMPFGLALPPWVQIARVGCLGAAGGFFWPTMQAYTTRMNLKGGLIEAIGRFNLSWSLSGILLGPTVASFLYRTSPALPFVVSVTIFGLAAILMTRLPLRRERETAAAHPDIAHISFHQASGYKYMARLACIVVFFAMGIVSYLFPKLAAERGLSTVTLGWLFFIHGGALIACFLAMKFTPRWHFQFPLILLALGAAVAGSLGVGYARAVPIVAAAMLAMGLARGFFAYSTIFYTLAAPGDRVESVGKNEALLSSGIIAGPLVGGLFAHITQNLPIAFALGALVVAVGSLHQVLIRQYIRSLERPPARG